MEEKRPTLDVGGPISGLSPSLNEKEKRNGAELYPSSLFLCPVLPRCERACHLGSNCEPSKPSLLQAASPIWQSSDNTCPAAQGGHSLLKKQKLRFKRGAGT